MVVVVGTVVVVVSVSVVVVVSVVELVDGGGVVLVTGGGVVGVVEAQSSLPDWPSFPAPFAHVFGGVVFVVVVVLLEVLEVSGGKQSSP